MSTKINFKKKKKRKLIFFLLHCSSLRAIQAQVKRELEAEKKKATSSPEPSESKSKQPEEVDLAPVLAVKGVYYKCPLIGPEILSKEEWNVKIRNFLYEQLPEEKGLTACLILYSLNKNREKVRTKKFRHA